MALSVLNNIASLAAQNQLTITNSNLQKSLFQLSSGSRINTGADDAAGLAIADGLHANITALTQSARNANDGVGELQVADGSLAQVTTLLNRAVTLATEAATGTVSDAQRTSLDAEFTAIKAVGCWPRSRGWSLQNPMLPPPQLGRGRALRHFDVVISPICTQCIPLLGRSSSSHP